MTTPLEYEIPVIRGENLHEDPKNFSNPNYDGVSRRGGIELVHNDVQ